MTDRIPVDTLLKEWEQDPAFQEAYKEMAPYYDMLDAMLSAMKESGITTQEELADRMGTSKQAISRMMNAKQLPSMKTILKFAAATGTRPILSFEPTHHGQ